MGLDVFKGEVEKLLGWKLGPARSYTFDRNIDDFGWSTGENGKHNFMMYIENGRVQDEDQCCSRSRAWIVARCILYAAHS